MRSRDALFVFLWSRVAVWIGALFALFAFPPNGDVSKLPRDDTVTIHDVGRVFDVWARWDSDWFIRIAHHGYEGAGAGAPAFYPLYPSVLAIVGRALGGHYVLAGVLVSLSACACAFVLLHRLATALAGADVARRSVLLLAAYPMSLFLQAVYNESLFLALALAAFLAAEKRRWLATGVYCGLSLLTRPTGVAVLLGVALLALRDTRRARSLGSVLVPASVLFLFFPVILGSEGRNPLAFVHAERYWYRETAWLGPIGGAWKAAKTAWSSLEQVAVGSAAHPYGSKVGADHFAALNLEATAFFVLAVVLGIVAWRRFGAPYGVMALAAVIAPVSTPAIVEPLLSMPRFTVVAFPIFLALGSLCTSPRAEHAVLGTSSVLLGVATVQWALWQFVS